MTQKTTPVLPGNPDRGGKWLLLLSAVFLIINPRPGLNDTGLQYRDFQIGSPRSTVEGQVAAEYKTGEIRKDEENNALIVVINEGNNERVVFRFDEGERLYSIRVGLGSNKDSIFLGQLLNHLERKYGSSTLTRHAADKRFIWRISWILQEGRYGIDAEYSRRGVDVVYRDIAADEKMAKVLLQRRFAAFSALLGSFGRERPTLRYKDFHLGDGRSAVLESLQRTYGADGITADADMGKCPNRKSLRVLLGSDDKGGAGKKGRNTILFFFDARGRLYEIMINRTDVGEEYAADLQRFMRLTYGPPAYDSGDMSLGRWEFEKKRLLVTVTYSDRVSVSLMDRNLLDGCIGEVEKNLFKGL